MTPLDICAKVVRNDKHTSPRGGIRSFEDPFILDHQSTDIAKSDSSLMNMKNGRQLIGGRSVENKGRI